MTDLRRPRLATELPLVVVDVVLVASMARLFDDRSFFVPLLVVVLVAHGLAIATRALELRGPAVLSIALVGAAVVISAVLLGETTAWGLPTMATWDAAAAALRDARERYPVVIAPTEATTGFLLCLAVALWFAAWFADWAAHRLRTTAEAVGPAAALFVFCSVLGSGQHEVVTAAAFAAAVLVYVAVARTEPILEQQRWLAGAPRTARVARTAAFGVAAVAVLAGSLAGPRLPGAGDEALLDWRRNGEGGGARVTVSPMVELQRRLVEQPDVAVFEVQSPRPAYWRLTSLDQFDGEIWTSDEEYGDADDALEAEGSPTDGPNEGEPFTQRFQIQGLATIWAPSAFVPVEVQRSDRPLRWNDQSATLIVAGSEETSDGMTYTVTSEAPVLRPVDLELSSGADTRAITERYEALPDDFPEVVADAAEEVTADAPNRYDQALALQDWFRSEFTYSLDTPSGHSDQALVSFLEDRIGYCEQFAGAFAAMARSLGIPSRVAVGFTPGIEDPERPGTYQVLGRHAHAWPEVHFPEVGWVPFEPTPQRGIPDASAYTGVPPAQATEDGAPEAPSTTAEVPTTTTPTPTTEPSDSPTPTEAPTEARTTGEGPEPASTADDGTPWPAVIAGAGALAVALLAVRWLRRRAARSGAPLDEVEQHWADATAAIAQRTSLSRNPAETAEELAARAAPLLDEATAADLVALAALVTRWRWAADGLTPGEVAEVAQLASRVADAPEPVGAGVS